jgi:hypothetical protein
VFKNTAGTRSVFEFTGQEVMKQEKIEKLKS